MMFFFCFARILLASAYYKTSTSRALLLKELTRLSEKFMNIQHSISTNLAIVETSQEYFSISVYGQKHQPCFCNVFVFHKLYKLCLTYGTVFQNLHIPGSQKFSSSLLFLQNFHLNLLRCLCRNIKRFLGLNNCLSELVQIAIIKLDDLNVSIYGTNFESIHRNLLVCPGAKISSADKGKIIIEITWHF